MKITFDELKKQISRGSEIDFNFRGSSYLIRPGFASSDILHDIKDEDIEDDDGCECRFETKEELIEKGTIQGHLLKDIIDEIEVNFIT